MSLIEKIRTVALSQPSVIALQYEERQMNYGEFVRRIGGLASGLHERGIGPGDRVAIALPRSFEMVIAIFGVLASGACYVPLDPSHPCSRLLALLEDAQASLLLGDSGCDELSASLSIPHLDPKDWKEQGTINEISNADKAYIIYTSGSTGKPKGVEVGHKALENYIAWATSSLPFKGGGVPLLTSMAFDHAITNIFPPLLMGEKLVLLPSIQGGRTLAGNLLSNPHLKNKKYSYVKLTPSLFEFLDKDQRALLGCRTHLLMFGGEKLSPSLIADARRDNPKLAIINHYGPTEATVGCCVYPLPKKFSGLLVPIGKPIPGMEASIRKSDLSLADTGTAGELLISGKGLADGYWQRPGLTQNSFILLNDKVYGERRWYRTGDLAQQLPDGTIECLGRMDDQIKILGYRIEPAEIVQQLNTFPGVQQSAVLGREHDGHTELVAALVFAGEQPSIEEIRKYLHARLPPPMVPARYLLLDELPMAESGKTDRKKILSLLPENKSTATIEEQVAGKFREILGVENMDGDDDYFLLGGDSLGTVEIAVWAGEHFNVTLEVSCLFDFPTVNSLSEHIRTLSGTETLT